MFLRYLSDHDYEEKFWPFVFRLETVLAGIVREGAGRLVTMTSEDAYVFLFDSLGNALDSQNGLLPDGWWPEPIPSIEWFDDYLRRETDFILAEVKRRPTEKNEAGKDEQEEGNESFDKRKVREYAHRNHAFQRFILPFSDPEDDHDHHHHEKE